MVFLTKEWFNSGNNGCLFTHTDTNGQKKEFKIEKVGQNVSKNERTKETKKG